MSDDRPHKDPLPEEDWQDPSEFDDAAIYVDDEDVVTGDWDDDMVMDDAYLDEAEDIDDLDASIYEPPEPPITDDEFESDEEPEDDGNWFKRNWRAIVLAALVLIILALVARAIIGRKEKVAPTPLPTATLVPLPTFTPTPIPEAIDTSPGAPSNTSPVETPAQSVQVPTATPPPAPAASGGIAIGKTVIVTGTGKDRLSLRAEPTTNSPRLKVIKDGVRLTVIAGPEQGDGYTWWKVRTPKGVEGWAVADYLKPQ